MEAEEKRKRRETTEEGNPEEIKSFDPNVKMNHFEAKGSYTMELVGQLRILRHTRSIEDRLQLPEAVESTLLVFINQSKCIYVHL